MTKTIPVIIIGGGLNGLTLAALLAHHRVACLLVERHQSTSIQYKFAGISPRSMEIFRGLGLEDEICSHRTGDQQGGGIARGKTLSDSDLEWSGAAWPDANPFSPTQPATCDQHVLEPILRRRAERLGADVRFNTEFLALEQDDQKVTVRIRHRSDGREETVAASYLVAADGAGGGLRDELGIHRSGPGVLQHWMNLIFETDMPPTLGGRRFTSCFVTDLNATFTPREGGRWLLALQYSPDRGERPEDFDAARCRELVVKGAGRAHVKADLVDARSWEVAAYVADRFSKGRCFLIGDAAHLMPPTGAFGGNSGIHDAHNLAWKLAYVLRGEAEPRLLDTYDIERRPVIEATLGQALARLQRWFRDTGGKLPPAVERVDDYAVVFGQRYREGSLIPGKSVDDRPFADPRTLSAVPGTRIPHRLIERSEQPLSTLDLFSREFVLLNGADDRWRRSANRIAAEGLSLICYRLGVADGLSADAGVWPEAFGVQEDGAVLVRPDGFVAWRSDYAQTEPEAVLREVLRRLGLRC